VQPASTDAASSYEKLI
jgi:predicted RecB family nuclease